MSEFISSNIWTILLIAWPVVFGLVMLALKRPSKNKFVELLAALVAFLIVSAVTALTIAVIAGVFLYLPGLLFGNAGVYTGIIVMFWSLVYMVEYNDTDNHKKAFKSTFLFMSFVVPIFLLLLKVG